MHHTNQDSRRAFLKGMSLLGTLPFLSFKELTEWASPAYGEIAAFGNVIEPPVDPAGWPAFRVQLVEWRKMMREKLGYNGEAYSDPAFKWAQSNYTCGFVFMYDLEFYDGSRMAYTIDKVIARGVKEFGGYDSIVLWHAYPRIGIDDRNQFDFYRDMPGGTPGLKKAVAQFHDKGIKVFINYNPWDTGTRRENKSDMDGLAEIVKDIDADGIFLDTLKNAAFDFRTTLDKIHPGIVVEGELAAELDVLPTHHLSWAQDFGDKYVPGILRNKWYEGRHMQHQISRWSRDHTTELHQAWINGSGIMVWENVFGQWLPWNLRDQSVLRTMAPIQRRYSAIFNGNGFVPMIKTEQDGIFASMWENETLRIWTLVNRHERTIDGVMLNIADVAGNVYYDLTEGRPAATKLSGAYTLVSGRILPRSVGCFISAKKQHLGSDFEGFLSQMRTIRKQYHHDSQVVHTYTKLKKVEASPLRAQFPANEMREIKPATVRQPTSVESRECGTYASQPVEAVDLSKSMVFDKTVHIPHLAMDIYPVTNRQFYEFVRATGYSPADKTNFLKHWHNGSYPEAKKDHPVVYVDINDARAYAQWAGRRLPREEEWQFAAQGYNGLKYPWGEKLDNEHCNSGDDTTAVTAFASGASPFGCMDMCGNTWELTESEYDDGHNHFLMLKGGCYYQAPGSHWYTRGGPLPSNVSTKFLLLYPGIDRCATIGFRCVMDLL